ncbi:MAG: hypothetical protein PWP64_1009 [Candidatus Cloacimonadota bacterium]|nr:hypothetical protein [Candidatus Cloacimonadota bacterium]
MSDSKNKNELTRKSEAIKSLPYGFVPINDKQEQPKPKINLAQYDPNLYSGYANCEIYALNDLCVGNSQNELAGEKQEITPLIVDGKIIIPSSTLRGCISNFIAAQLGLKLRRLNDAQYGFRPNNAPSGSSIKSYAGLIESIKEDGTIEVKRFNDEYFAFVREAQLGYSPSQRYFDHNRYGRQLYKYKIDRNGDKTGNFYFYKYHDGLDGAGTLSPQKRHQCFGVLLKGDSKVPDFDEQRFFISPQCHQEYKNTIKYLTDDKTGHLKDHPKFKDKNSKEIFKSNLEQNCELSKNDVIFFEIKHNSHQILTFGKHYRYRWAFKRNLHSFTKDYQAEDAENLKQGLLNTIEEMFGYSSSNTGNIPYMHRSKSGKVHFSCAVHEAGTGIIRDHDWLPRQGSPKPSSYEFYLKENFWGDDQSLLSTYGDPARDDFVKDPRLSGYKFYYRIWHPKFVAEENGIVKLRHVLSPERASAYPKFIFRVHFENLSTYELTLLCFALNLGQNTIPSEDNMKHEGDHTMLKTDDGSEESLLCHQIGYGKNYGMGAIKIVVEEQENKPIFHRLKLETDSLSLKELFWCFPKYQDSMEPNLRELCKLYSTPRAYPRFKEEIYNWHTQIKNDDLKKRRNHE